MWQGQTYLIIGASGGVGSEVARQLVQLGARVVLAGKTESKLSALSTELRMPYQAVDATRLEAVDNLLHSVQKQYGNLSGAVNCVGSLVIKPAHLVTEEEWLAVLASNLTSAFSLVRAAGKSLREQGGSVVLVSAAVAGLGMPNHEAISAAKGGINALMRSAAATYASDNLRFNCIAPGLVDTPLTNKITQSEDNLAISLAAHPLGRIGYPRDIANAICFLLNPDSSWITGQVIAVDGGLSSLKGLARKRA